MTSYVTHKEERLAKKTVLDNFLVIGHFRLVLTKKIQGMVTQYNARETNCKYYFSLKTLLELFLKNPSKLLVKY